MARKKINIRSTEVFHITNRSHNKNWFPLPLEEVWTILADQLNFVRYAYGLRVFSFVLMANHFHLLAMAPKKNLSEAMRYFLRESSRTINLYSGQINQVWGGRFHRCEINSYIYFLNAYKYVYQNPVRAGISKSAEDYPYSTLNQLLGKSPHSIVVEDEIMFYGDLNKNIQWLNTLPSDEMSKSVRVALGHTSFRLPKLHGRLNPLENGLL